MDTSDPNQQEKLLSRPDESVTNREPDAVVPDEGDPAQAASSAGNQADRQAYTLLEQTAAKGESAALWNDWATMQYAAGKIRSAEDGYRHCLQLDPGHRQASISLAFLLLGEERAEEADRYLASFALSTEESAAVQKLRATCALKLKVERLEAAVEFLLVHTLNSSTPATTGEPSNHALNALFMKLLISVKPAWFLDIGANDGAAARVIKKIQPACEVWAFEANPQIHSKFAPLFAGTGANYVNLAISEKSGPIQFFAPRTLSRAVVDGEIIDRAAVEPIDTGKTSMYKRTENSTYQEFTVEGVRLDDFVALRDVPLNGRKIALWIDVEGAAFEVLSGATAALSAVSIILVESENHEFWQNQKQCGDIASLLIAAGFVPVARDREYGDKQFNTVFLHQSFLGLLYPDSYRLNRSDKQLQSGTTAGTAREITTAPAYHIQYTQPAGCRNNSSGSQTRVCTTVENPGFVSATVPNCSTWNNLSSAPDCSTWNNSPQGVANSPLQSNIFSQAALAKGRRAKTTFRTVAAQAASQMPIFVPVFDNPTYARMMLSQLISLGLPNIYLVDNGSTYRPMLQFLEEADSVATIIRNENNPGPREVVLSAFHSDCVPDIFCVTDPDLEFSPHLPGNFLSELALLTKTYKLGKAGFALRLDDAHLMHGNKFTIIGKEWHATQWEAQFWKEPMDPLPDGSPVFRAIIDTTFAVYNKRHFTPNSFYLAARVAGNYTCRHLPWYHSSGLPDAEASHYRKTQKYSLHLGGVEDTTISGVVKSTDRAELFC